MRKLFSLFTALTLTAGLWATNSVITFTSTSKLFFGTDYFENAEEQVLDYKYIYDEISKTGTITFNGELVTIWGNLTTSSGCFEGCSLLTSITLPEGLTKVGDVAFLGCSSLASVTLPESLTTIGQLTFHGCSIKSITIPKNVKEIGVNAFMDCSGLTDFYVAWTTTLPTLQGPVFENTPINTATLHVPAGSLALYQNADQWKNFGSIVEYVPQEVKDAAIAAVNAEITETDNDNVKAIATDVATAINAATTVAEVNILKTLAIAAITSAKAASILKEILGSIQMVS